MNIATTCSSNTIANETLNTVNARPQSFDSAPTPSSQPADSGILFDFPPLVPWPDPVNGPALLDELVQTINRFVVLPQSASEALALWVLHTYAFQLRDVTTYIGIQSPEHRCGKSTLITVLSQLAHRPVVSSNISPPAFFRIIEDLQPTLFIDEADTFLAGNDQLRGILNAGYTRSTAFVLRAASQSSLPAGAEPAEAFGKVSRFSCWCPKVIARIGRLPATLADRCILLHMQRKTINEGCERIKNLGASVLGRKCARFVLDHSELIARAEPSSPPSLNDRAADIWEPLLVLADLAGAHWPVAARQAAIALSASPHESNPAASLLLDVAISFFEKNTDRIFTRTIVDRLNAITDRPWMEFTNGKPITDCWLSKQLRPYGIRSKTLRIGEYQAKGYLMDDCREVFLRYIPKSELDSLRPVPEPEPKLKPQAPATP
jgi:hypothetical protein